MSSNFAFLILRNVRCAGSSLLNAPNSSLNFFPRFSKQISVGNLISSQGVAMSWILASSYQQISHCSNAARWSQEWVKAFFKVFNFNNRSAVMCHVICKRKLNKTSLEWVRCVSLFNQIYPLRWLYNSILSSSIFFNVSKVAIAG